RFAAGTRGGLGRRGLGAGVALGRGGQRGRGAGLRRLRRPARGRRPLRPRAPGGATGKGCPMSRAAPPTGAHATGAHATGAHATGTAAPGGARAVWHRRTGALPLAYLAAIVVVGFAHPALPQWRWLAVHLLLLGAVTNAIVIWSAHFSAAVLRIPAPASRRGEAVRLAVLNAGVLAVLAGGTAGRPWLGAVGAVVVFGAICAHLAWLAARLRAAL